MSDARLVLVILAVGDVGRAAAFYRAAFGWEQVVDVAVYAELTMPGGMRLGLYRREGFAHNTGELPVAVPAGAIGPTELYVHVAQGEMDAAIERVARAGARWLSPRAPRDWGDDAAYFADPDGNVVVVACVTR